MKLFFIFIVIFKYFVNLQVFSQIPSYHCSWSSILRFAYYDNRETIIRDQACYLRYLNLNVTNKNFNWIPKKPKEKVFNVILKDSYVEVLTDDICKGSSFIKFINAPNVRMSIIEENALQLCTDLEVVVLTKNSIETLPRGIFASNKNLMVVDLDFNKLSNIDADLFKSQTKLKILDFAFNQITDASFIENIPESNSLTAILLSNNSLFDINLQDLVAKFPNLNEIHLSHNKFWCDRQKTILELFESKNLKGKAEGECTEVSESIKFLRTNDKIIQHQLTNSIQDLRSTTDNDQKQFNLLNFIIFGTILIFLAIAMGVGYYIILKKINGTNTKLEKLHSTVMEMIEEKEGHNYETPYSNMNDEYQYRRNMQREDNEEEIYDNLRLSRM